MHSTSFLFCLIRIIQLENTATLIVYLGQAIARWRRKLQLFYVTVLYYRLENGDVIVARPSGTEPKIKFYYLLQAEDESDAKAKLSRYAETLNARV